MDIKNPAYLKKIVEHYQNRINKLRSDKSFEIRTEIADGFIDEILKSAPGLIIALSSMDSVIKIDENAFPNYHNIICMALDQYVRDLNVDWNTLENRLSHNPIYLKQIKKEIEIAEDVKKDCSCRS